MFSFCRLKNIMLKRYLIEYHFNLLHYFMADDDDRSDDGDDLIHDNVKGIF